MKIIAPIVRADALAALAEAGADELFGGVFDPEWEQLYGSAIEYNRRGCYGKRANISDWAELERILRLCNELGLRFSLTMNALRFSQRQLPALRRIMERYRDIGGTDIIVSEPLLCTLAREYKFKTTLSSCAGCISQETAAFYAELGCDGIIFPRDMSLDEMEELKNAVPQLSYEAFLMYSGCRYNDGSCRALHNTPFRELCQFCDTGDWFYQRRDGKPMSAEDTEYTNQCGSNYARYLKNACGQCALYRLKGIAERVKVLERAGSTERLLKAVRLTRQNLDISEFCRTEAEYLESMLRPEQVVCAADCYYPDSFLKIKEQSHEQ